MSPTHASSSYPTLARSFAAASLAPAFLRRAFAQTVLSSTGYSARLTGALASAGISIKNTTEATMAHFNAKRGVNGRKLKLQVLDDGYAPARTVDNIKSMISAIKKNSPGMPIASISVVLTPQVAKALGSAGSGMALTMVCLTTIAVKYLLFANTKL